MFGDARAVWHLARRRQENRVTWSHHVTHPNISRPTSGAHRSGSDFRVGRDTLVAFNMTKRTPQAVLRGCDRFKGG